MSDQQLNLINQQLETLTRLVALSLVQARERLSDQIDILRRAKLPPKEIAELLGTTPNTVSVQMSRQRAQNRTQRRPGPVRTPRQESQTEDNL